MMVCDLIKFKFKDLLVIIMGSENKDKIKTNLMDVGL